jgi:PAS domain S-box-containing protein
MKMVRGAFRFTMAMRQESNRHLEETVLAQSYNDAAISLTGAGTSSTDFTMQPSQARSSAAIEFAKDQNWMQRIVEELQDLLHILTPDGRILYISERAKQLTGFAPEELIGKSIVDYIHPDDRGIFVREFDDSIASGGPLRLFYRFLRQTGEYAIFECHGHPHLTSEAASYRQNNSSTFCSGYFMMARPYPAKNAALLDSFLEQKIENERLMKKIETLRREEAEEQEDYQHHWKKEHEGYWEQYPSDENKAALSVVMGHSTGAELIAMPPPVKPPVMNSTSTRQGLENGNASSKPDSIEEKMARYGGATHIETIEMLTGLRYQEGERSQGISTGDASPTLIRGDAGIIIPPGDKDERSGDKKKKTKVADEHACRDCGMRTSIL